MTVGEVAPPRFLVDHMLIKLGKYLRIVGQDAAYVIDSTLARSELGWRPEVDFETGVQQVIEWVREHWDELSQYTWDYQHQP